MVTSFVGPIRAQVNRAIYVWGGNGEVVTSEQQIRNAETSVANADRAIKLYRLRQAAGISPILKMDCSGMIVWQLRNMGIFAPTKDMTADMFARICPTINKADLRVGDFVFNLNSDGRAYHIGVVSKIDKGALYVTEAFGRDLGVIERHISAGYWDDWSHNPYIDTSEEVSDLIQKGSPVAEVVAWQESLLAAGYKMTSTDGTIEYGADGSFGGATTRATQKFQLDNGLPQTGTVDNLTWAKMVTAVSAKTVKALSEEVAKTTYLTGQIKESQKIIGDQNITIKSLEDTNLKTTTLIEDYRRSVKAILGT